MQLDTKIVRFNFDNEAYTKIIEDNGRKVVAHAYCVAVELAITAKHGSGIINRAQLPDSDIEAMREAMAPLISVLEREAIMSVGRVLNGMLANPNLRDYLQRRTAANIGRTGGRKPHARKPKTEWLESVMRLNQARHPQATLTLREHKRAIKAHDDIQEEEDGKLAFGPAALDMFKAKGEVFISDVTIGKMLTFIKKYPA